MNINCDNNDLIKNSNIKISVALCTYNGVFFIEQQVISILSQTFPVYEIIISDDGSKDGTVDLIRQIIKSRKRIKPTIKLLGGERLGITRNFNRAINACSGDIIFLCDQDDIWLPEKVSRIISEFQFQPDALLACSNAIIVDKQAKNLGVTQFQMVRMGKTIINLLRGKNAFYCLMRRNVVTGATVAFRRQLIEVAIPFVDGWLHDEWLAIIAAGLGPLIVVEQPLILYRQHDGNQCGMKPTSILIKIERIAATRGLRKNKILRINNLLERVIMFPNFFDNKVLTFVQECCEFETNINKLPKIRFERFFYVLNSFLKGHYYRYSGGWRSAIKDIFMAN